MKALPRIRNEVVDTVAHWLLQNGSYCTYLDIPNELLQGQRANEVLCRIVAANRFEVEIKYMFPIASDGRPHRLRAVKVISISPERRGTRTAVKGTLHTKDGNPIVVQYASMRHAEKDGFIGVCIGACLRGKQKTHIGYTWEAV